MKTIIVAIALVGLVGCEGKNNLKIKNQAATPSDQPNLGNGAVLPPTAPPGPAHCATGRAYAGFGGMDLTSDRVDQKIGLDRDRLKPYSALGDEYARVLGSTPAAYPDMANTFSVPPDRWSVEPKANAISVYGAFRLAFQGCLGLTASDPQFNTSPTNATATALCTQWQSRFWNRVPSSDEVQACVTFATNISSESNPQRQWAYACAAVLTSGGFLGY